MYSIEVSELDIQVNLETVIIQINLSNIQVSEFSIQIIYVFKLMISICVSPYHLSYENDHILHRNINIFYYFQSHLLKKY
jgi:predicted ferric reductase